MAHELESSWMNSFYRTLGPNLNRTWTSTTMIVGWGEIHKYFLGGIGGFAEVSSFYSALAGAQHADEGMKSHEMDWKPQKCWKVTMQSTSRIMKFA